ncbi:hypothetical protein BDW27_109133 [Nocardiopsis sp. L17-MgMaSL7]|nr:hypothetical protein [Nocardiopsis sp. L17-MgMaSL7]PWV49279.1 hypothetical protein BDW27_109133 [Nocardiopsis sp. L17-MgMaSL7]
MRGLIRDAAPERGSAPRFRRLPGLAAWAELFARGGGRVLRHRVTPDDLVSLRADHELVVIAAGRGELAGIFPRDERRHARQVTAWSRVMLTGPHHVWELYRLADRHPPTADRFANSFGDPAGLIDWFLHPEGATAYVDGVRRTCP